MLFNPHSWFRRRKKEEYCAPGEPAQISLSDERFAALVTLADRTEPDPAFYFVPHMVLLIEQLARWLDTQFKRVKCGGCGKRGLNYHVIEASKACRYPEGWESQVENALSKLPPDARANEHVVATIVRTGRDQFQVVERVALNCQCMYCKRVRTWVVDGSVLGLIAGNY